MIAIVSRLNSFWLLLDGRDEAPVRVLKMVVRALINCLAVGLVRLITRPDRDSAESSRHVIYLCH